MGILHRVGLELRYERRRQFLTRPEYRWINVRFRAKAKLMKQRDTFSTIAQVGLKF